MAIDLPATREWARQHKAAWEIAPLQEVRRGDLLQLGFALDLYAQTPDAANASDDVLAGLWDRLREIAESLVPLVGPEGRLEVEPFDVATRFRPETQFAPELLLQARLLHSDDAVRAVSEADRERLRPLESRLLELGLRARNW